MPVHSFLTWILILTSFIVLPHFSRPNFSRPNFTILFAYQIMFISRAFFTQGLNSTQLLTAIHRPSFTRLLLATLQNVHHALMSCQLSDPQKAQSHGQNPVAGATPIAPGAPLARPRRNSQKMCVVMASQRIRTHALFCLVATLRILYSIALFLPPCPYSHLTSFKPSRRACRLLPAPKEPSTRKKEEVGKRCSNAMACKEWACVGAVGLSYFWGGEIEKKEEMEARVGARVFGSELRARRLLLHVYIHPSPSPPPHPWLTA